MVVAVESSLHHGGEIAALMSGLVYRDTERGESRQVHEQVVHEISEVAVVVFSYHGSERHSVDASEGMVADEGVELAVVLVGQVLGAFNLERHVEILHTVFEPLHTDVVLVLPQERVHLFLVDYMPKPSGEHSRHVACLVAHLVLKYFVYVNRILCYFHLIRILFSFHKKNEVEKWPIFYAYAKISYLFQICYFFN